MRHNEGSALVVFSRKKSPVLLGEVADSRSETGKIQGEAMIFYCTRKQRSAQRLKSKVNFNELPLTIFGTI